MNYISKAIIGRWKLILFCLSAGFLMVALPKLGLKIPELNSLTKTTFKLVSPEVEKKDNFENIKPKLETKTNDFKLKKLSGGNLVTQTFASDSDFDQASSYVVVDFNTGEIILSKNSDKKLPIASLTKIMTSVVATDLLDEDEYLEVSEKASNIEPTRMGVMPAQQLTSKELLHALLLTSANDAAEVLLEGVDKKYQDDIFIKAMNSKANFLRLENSSFDNPQGFDGQKNYSTSEDLAVLTHYALTNYPTIEQIVKKDYHFLPEDSHHKQFDLYNWNGLLGTYPGVSGVKIGNTGDAGKTTVVVSERNGKKLIAVLLGAPGVLERDLWTSQILDQAFQKAYNLEPVNLTEEQLKAKYATWKYWN